MQTPQTIDDILENPKAYGLPTFKEYCARAGKMRSDDDKFSRIDKSSQTIKNKVRRHIYYFENYKCNNLESVQNMCREFDVDFTKLLVKPQLIEDRNDPEKCDIIVKFERPLSMLLGIKT